MNTIPIGVATSVSKEKEYDPLDTIQFSVEHNIPFVQIYVTSELINNKHQRKEIKYLATKYKKIITCHLPDFLCKDSMSDEIVFAAKNIMIFQKVKRIIVHFNENENSEYFLKWIALLHKNGFTVCVENYFKKTDELSLQNNIHNYHSLFVLSKRNNFSVLPVLDFPRLFIADIYYNTNSLHLCKKMCIKIADLSLPVIYHIIDFTNYDQKRQNWCAFGKGLMPYHSIFSFMKEIGIIPDHIILEFEDKNMFLESVSSMKQLLTL